MITFEKTNTGLRLMRNDTAVMSFEIGQKILSAAKGVCSYSMNRGSFKIKDKLSGKTDLKLCDVILNEDGAVLRLTEGKVYLTVSGDTVKFTPKLTGSFNRLFIELPSSADEHLFGSGETFTEFDLKGNKFNVWVAEHQNMKVIAGKLLKIALGDRDSVRKMKMSKYETYYAQPTFISSKKYFFHSETTGRSVFDFTDEQKNVIITDTIAPYYVGFASDFESLMTGLTDILGRQPELPDWVYDGYILGIQGGTEIMLEKLRKALDAGIKVNGVWIQDWEKDNGGRQAADVELGI